MRTSQKSGYETSQPERPETSAAPHPREIIARVQPEDAERVQELADLWKTPVPIMAGVAASIGTLPLRDVDLGMFLPPACGHPPTYGSNRMLWTCINRCPDDYSEELRAVIPQRWDFITLTSDAEQLGRTVGDWAGTTLHVGLQVIACEIALERVVKRAGFAAYLAAAEFEAGKADRERSAAGSLC